MSIIEVHVNIERLIFSPSTFFIKANYISPFFIYFSRSFGNTQDSLLGFAVIVKFRQRPLAGCAGFNFNLYFYTVHYV